MNGAAWFCESFKRPTFCTGVHQAGSEVLALENFFHHVISVHSCVVHSFQLRLHGVLLHWVSEGRIALYFGVIIFVNFFSLQYVFIKTCSLCARGIFGVNSCSSYT